MKKFIVVLLFVLVPQLSNAGRVYTTLGDLMSGVRNRIADESKSLPDSIVKQACQNGLLTVSTEIGGVEAQYRIVLDTGVGFYAIPDTIVEVVKLTLINGKYTKSIRPIDPDFYEYTGEELPAFLTGAFNADDNDVPFGYDIWADSIQLTPAPNKIDTLYLKCLVEHPQVDSTGTILLRGTFIEAALLYAAHWTMDYKKDYEASAYFLTLYEKKRAALLARYRPKYARGASN